MNRPALLALALAAGLVLHGRPVGMGLTLTALGLLALAARGGRGTAWAWALAAGFALVPSLRAAGWVQAIGVAGTLTFALVAAAGFATVGGAVRAVGRGLAALVPGPLVVLAPLLAGMRGRWGRTLPAARGVALAAALLVPFGALFATADAAFAEWVESAGEAVPDLDAGLLGRLAIAVAVLAVGGALGLARPAPPREPGAAGVGRTEWLIALVALNALFAAFVAVQVATLFGGRDHVLRTAGLTYAEYARQGFWQLVAVAALTLAVIAAARRWSLRAGARDERLQRLLLGGLCVLTLVVLVSAHRRLGLYVDAFGMTRLRILAEWGILFLGGLFAIVLLAHRLSWFAQAAVGFAGVALLVLALTNPDGRIAATNLARFEQTGRIDRALLRSLSLDAAPARGCRTRAVPAGGAAGLNLGRHRARGLPRCG